MKFKLYPRLLIATFLIINLPAFSAKLNDKTDTLNPQKMLKQLDSIRAKLQSATIVCKPQALILPRVVAVESPSRTGNIAVFGDYINIKIDSIAAMMALTDSIAGKQRDSMGDVILYINGNAMRDIGVMNIDRQEHELIFHLDRHSQYLMKFYPEFTYLWSYIPVSVSAGFKNGMILPLDPALKAISLKYVSRWSIVFSLLFILSMITTFIVLAAKTNLIRIGDDRSPFSLALTQLSFWSIVVASSFIYIWIVTGELPPITGSTLILLSVSALTTAGSRLVDIRSKTKGDLTQDSDGFMEDILQDELGYSVHRAQMFMWTVIMGIIFVTSVIRFQQIPQLDESLLALMGISSGAYVGLKTMENKKEPDLQIPVDKKEGDAAGT